MAVFADRVDDHSHHRPRIEAQPIREEQPENVVRDVNSMMNEKQTNFAKDERILIINGI